MFSRGQWKLLFAAKYFAFAGNVFFPARKTGMRRRMPRRRVRLCRPKGQRMKACKSRQTLSVVVLSALFAVAIAPRAAAQAQASTSAPARKAGTSASAPRTPSEVVREFYRALRERRFREAFALSVFNPAVEGLSAEEFQDLQVDFERIAAGVPADIALTGEQLSGEEATVYMKLGDDAAAPKVEPVFLIRENGAWLVGDREKRDYVRKAGKKFFFEARIETHHAEVEAMLKRIVAAEFIYSSQHGGAYGDLAALVRAGLVPQDLLGTDTTGYRFRVAVGQDAKTYTATAEPAIYGRTGKLSFYLDQSTPLQSKDTGGKPLKPSSKKQ